MTRANTKLIYCYHVGKIRRTFIYSKVCEGSHGETALQWQLVGQDHVSGPGG